MSFNGLQQRNGLTKNVAAKPQATGEKVTEFKVNGEAVTLSLSNVRDFLISGDKKAVTVEELVMFINLCKFNHLNPWLREAYCIKFGNEPATMVISKEAYMKRAFAHDDFDGFSAGVVVLNQNGVIEYRIGTITLPSEKILGGFAEVYKKGTAHAYRVEVSLEEYIGRKKDGTPNGQWTKKPATMIRKVALVQALREAYPATYGNMYTSEEVGINESELPSMPVEQPKKIEVSQAQVIEPQPQVAEPKPVEVESAPVDDTEQWDSAFNV